MKSMFRFFLASVLFVLLTVVAYAEDSYLPVTQEYERVAGVTEETVLGIDFSTYEQRMQSEDWNKSWMDYKGKTVNVFSFLKSQGINTISVKVIVDPQSEKTQWLTVEHAISTFKEAKAAGLKIDAVLLFSDEVTYKGHQPLPAAWVGLNSEELQQTAAEYAADTVRQMQDAGVCPDIVTIGQEINYDFLDFTGDENWKWWGAMGLVTQSVRETAGNVKIAIGLADPGISGDTHGIKWYVAGDNNLNHAWSSVKNEMVSCEYDYLGISFYPTDRAGDYQGDEEYLKSIVQTYQENQTGNYSEETLPPLILTGTNVTYIEEKALDPEEPSGAQYQDVDLAAQMKGTYRLLRGISIAAESGQPANSGGLIWNEGDVMGGWNSLFAQDGSALPTIAVIARAATGDRSDIIDPYRWGGDTGLRYEETQIKALPDMAENTIRGVDASSWYALKQAGVKFYDDNGDEAPLFQILKDNGVNYVRIRIWNDPKDENGLSYGGGGNDVETGLEIANEAKKYDMKVLLCFHYSDFWTSPGVQTLPKAWAVEGTDPNKVDAAALEAQYYEFTKDTVRRFEETGAEIGMVQVGNEITRGLSGAHSQISWKDCWQSKAMASRACSFLKAGIKATREESPDALIALHLANPTVARYQPIMDVWKANGIDYDVLGTSYYPFYSAEMNTPANLQAVSKLASDYGKYICVLEHGWVNTLKDADGQPNSIGDLKDVSSYPVNVQGQIDAMYDMYRVLTQQSNGLGAFYWEPAWIPTKAGWCNWDYNRKIAERFGSGWASPACTDYYTEPRARHAGASGWENCALFDTNGYPLPSLAFFKETITKDRQQSVRITPVNDQGTRIAADQIEQVLVGTERVLTLRAHAGYTPDSYDLSVIGNSDGDIQKLSVTYHRMKKGQSFSVSGVKFKVTKLATASAAGSVRLIKGENKKTSVVPKAVKLTDRHSYKVTAIGKKAFAKTKAKTVVVKTKSLTKNSVKGSLKSSHVKKIKVSVGSKKVNKKYVKKYKKIFTKRNAGKKVVVK